MARFPFERARRGRGMAAAAVLFMALASAMPYFTPAAGLSGDLYIKEYRNLVYTPDGPVTLDDVVITHGDDTRITAAHARYLLGPGGSSELNLTDKVHIEFRGALLDADSALLKFSGQELRSVAVKGSQATFSHQPEGYTRRIHGSADAIEFDAGTGKVTFLGNGSYTNGRHSLTSDVVVYDINDGTAADDGDSTTRGQAIIRLGEPADRVPPPRQPDRSLAE